MGLRFEYTALCLKLSEPALQQFVLELHPIFIPCRDCFHVLLYNLDSSFCCRPEFLYMPSFHLYWLDMFRSILPWSRIPYLLPHLQKGWISLCRTIEGRLQMIERSITSYYVRNVKRMWLVTHLSLVIIVESFSWWPKALVFFRFGLNLLEWWLLDGILSWRWRRRLKIYIFPMLGDVFATTVVHDRIEKCPYSAWLKIRSLFMLSIYQLTLYFIVSRPSASIWWSYKSLYSVLCPYCPLWVYLFMIFDVVITRSRVFLI